MPDFEAKTSSNHSLADASRAAVCPICSTGPARFFASGYDRLFRLAPGRYNLHRCRTCGCVFQSPLPERHIIPQFYPENYWWAEGPRPVRGLAGRLHRLERAYREFVASDHVRFLVHCARGSGAGERTLLDIGCGGGLFLHLARQRGFVSHGMDVSARAVEVVREQYGLDVRQGAVGEDVWKGRRFDFITMFHLLEHLTDPQGALEYARSLLKPGGGLIVQVPNLASLQARCFRHRWYGLDVPRHIINFTPRGLESLLSKAGFKTRDTARFSLRDNPASIASSLAPWLDPVGRGGRGLETGVLTKAGAELIYFGLVVLCLPLALFESALGLGGTIWVHVRPAEGAR